MQIVLGCKIVDGQVVAGPLNIAWMSEEQRQSEGWLPAELVKPLSFIDALEVWLPDQFEIHADKVIVTKTKRDKTPEELAAEEAARLAAEQEALNNQPPEEEPPQEEEQPVEE